mmetsp:Transcript_7121/g.23601  ORF Transcript_7121/g.23601 Transcript_7121/m.23601 type:complete len:580 (+) Transcript_7121:125-1864(+)
MDLVALKNMSEETSEVLQSAYLKWRAQGHPKQSKQFRHIAQKVLLVLRFSKRFQLAGKTRGEAREKALLCEGAMRTQAQLSLIEEHLLRLRFFEQMPNAVMCCRELAKVVALEQHQAGGVVFYEGDSGTNFYIIASGSVSVTRTEEGFHSVQDLWQAAKTGAKDGKAASKWSLAASGARNMENPYKHQVLLAKLKQGEGFGDIALVSGGGGCRTATVTAREPLQLLVIQREDFEKTIQGAREMELAERIQILTRMPLFREVSRDARGMSALAGIARLLMPQTFSRGSLVVRQGEPNDQLFFLIIQTGSLRVVRQVSRKLCVEAEANKWQMEQRTSHMSMVPRPPPDEDISRQNGKLTLGPLGGAAPAHAHNNLNAGVRRKKKREKLAFEVDILDRFQHFVRQLPPPGGTSTAGLTSCANLIAASETTVLFLNKWDFLKRVSDMFKFGAPGLIEECSAQLKEYEDDYGTLQEWARGKAWEAYKGEVVRKTLEAGGKGPRSSEENNHLERLGSSGSATAGGGMPLSARPPRAERRSANNDGGRNGGRRSVPLPPVGRPSDSGAPRAPRTSSAGAVKLPRVR